MTEQNKIKILFAEDDPDFRETLTEILTDNNYQVVAVENGKQAEEHIYRESFDLYLIDYNMPVVDGAQFVSRLKMKDPQAIVIMLTGVNDADKIVNLMKLGIFDYLVKPSKIEVIENTITNALNFKKTLEEQYERKLQSAKEIQDRVLWNEYKKNALESTTSVTREVLENMRRNLLQGSGLGSQLSIINLIDVMKGEKDEDGKYRISGDILDLLIGNSVFSQKQLTTLTNALAILSINSFVLTPIKVSEILIKFNSDVARIKTILTKNKSCEILFEPIKHDEIVKVNMDYLNLVLEEVLINAAKYCANSSRINIYTYTSEGFIFIAVKNSIHTDREGVPTEYESLVLEPFFRLSKEAEDSYLEYDEKYSTGLGLCVVNYIVKKHNGLFWIKNHKDHINLTSGLCTIAEIGLPIG